LRIEDAESRLTRAFGRRLPGPEAQKLLAPRPRKGWQPGVTPDDCRHGAGLLLLYPEGDETRLLLTKRNIHLPQHAGQVSLPGGAVEADETIGAPPGNNSSLRANIRETVPSLRLV
jgi:hypothetical protein